MAYLVATAWIKDEAPYLSQWIEFHLLQGFEKFYFFDNGSTDGTEEVLKPYIKAGIVEFSPYPTEVTQRKNFWVIRHSLDTFKNNHKWLFHHSIDEYMFCPNGQKVSDFLRKFENNAGVCIPWMNFNSSGKEKMEDGLVIERFKTWVDDPNRHIKTVVQPDKTYDCIGNPHCFIYLQDFAVYANGKQHDIMKIHGGAMHNDPYLLNDIRIHHYCTMSREEYDTKMNKGLLDISQEQQRRADAENFWAAMHPDQSLQNEDTSLFKYIEIVKENMRKRYEQVGDI
jgi:glycosyltransferase involved in cell wall biosynthesis